MIIGSNIPSSIGYKHEFTNSYLNMKYMKTDITLHSTS